MIYPKSLVLKSSLHFIHLTRNSRKNVFYKGHWRMKEDQRIKRMKIFVEVYVRNLYKIKIM